MKLSPRTVKLVITLIVTIAGALGWIALDDTSPQLHVPASNPGLYQVDHAADGDTIVVKQGNTTEKVRLIGVDTPEKNDSRKPIQCFAKAASAFTASKIQDQRVRLEADPQGDSRDRYGRLLRYVYLPDGTLLNKAIIEEGYGFAMTGFPFTKMGEFRAAERDAREHNRGLWATCHVDMARGYPQTNAGD